jgi:hypothetical protein
MKICRHLHYIQHPDSCFRYELTFDPPIDVESTLGKIDSFYIAKHFTGEGTSNRIEKTANVINRSGLLHIREVMVQGEVLSIDINSGYRLDQIVKGDDNELQVFVRETGLTYVFTIGKKGVFQVTGRVIKDDDGFYQKLNFDLTDMAMRNFIVRKSLANFDESLDVSENIPDLMDAREAARHYWPSKSWFEKKRASREIPVTKHRKMKREDIESLLGKSERKKRG